MNRTIAPNYTQPDHLEIEFPLEVELKNGVKLFWMKDVKDESVKLDIEWAAGSKYQAKKLTASFTNKLLLSGYGTKSATEIAEEVDFYGGFIQREMDRDDAGLSIFALNDNIHHVFAVFRDAFENCSFPEEEFEKERTIASAQYNIDSKKVKTLSQREFNKAVFGKKSIYGQVASIGDYDLVNLDDIKEFYNTFYKGNKPTLFLVGNVSDDFIRDLSDWTATMQFANRAQKENQIFHQFKGEKNELIEDAIQSAIRVGRLAMMKNHPDYFGFQVLNTILGGYFGSRLMLNIREDKGYTYGIGSAISVMEDASSFFVSTEVAKAFKNATVNEIFKEFDLLRNKLVPEDELQRVKNYMLGEFLREADGPIAMLENFKNIYFNHLPPTYYTDFIHAIHALTPIDLQVLANRYLQRKDFAIIITG